LLLSFPLFFYKICEYEGRTGSVGDGELVGWGGIREKMMEDEYGTKNVYTCM
jgi:hypothetical protein